jgi:AsmA protein
MTPQDPGGKRSAAIRPLAWMGIGIGGLALLAVAAAALLPSVVNLDRYRTLLAQRVGRALGREVTLGALHVSLWRGIGAEATGLQVSQAPGFGSEPFLTAEALRVRVQLLPLFRGEVKVASAVLDRPRFRLVHGKDGRWSVDDLFKAHTLPPPAKPPAESPRLGKAPLLGGHALSEVRVRNGEIELLELGQPTAVTLTLTDVDLSIRQESPIEPIDLRSRARFGGAASGQIEATAKIAPGDKEGVGLDARIIFKEMELKAWQQPVSGGREGSALSGPLSGEVRVTGPLARMAFGGTLNLTSAALQAGEAFRKPAGEDARITFQGQREDAGLRVTKLTLLYRDTTVDGTLHVPDVQIPRITFTATSAKVNLDRLMAPPPSKQAGLEQGVAWAATPERPAPKAGTSNLSVQGRLNIGELTYHGLAWSAVSADIRYQGGVVQLPEIRANFMNGRLAAKGEVDLRPMAPRVSFTSRLDNVATEPLVKALALGSWKLTSDLSSENQVEFVGLTLPNMLGSATGNGSVQLRKGRLTDYPPLDRLAEVASPLLAAQGVRVRLNEFEQLSGHYTLEKGMLRTKDLTLTKTEGTVTASGTLGLLDSGLDFDVVAKLGRATVEAKVAGTTAQPIVVPKLARLQRKIEGELDKALPGPQGQGLKELLKGLFGR